MSGSRSIRALKACFPKTFPVMAGYVFLGITYGVLMRTAGFPWWLPTVTALIVYTGSLEFLLVEILLSPFSPVSTFVTSLMIGARHLFYGISMLGRYRNTGWKKPYLIYTTSDETFALNASVVIPPGVDRGWYYFWVSVLDQFYWVAGSTIGGLGGGIIRFNTDGLSFVMTAMFLVIFLNQWEKDGMSRKRLLRDHVSELTGVLASAVCVAVFGPDRFMVPALLLILAVLAALKRKLWRTGDPAESTVEKEDGR